VKLGILADPNSFSALVVLKDWYRSGAETYLAICRIECHDDSSKDIAIKACIALTEKMSVDATLSAWIRRRTHVAAHGVETPRLYGFGEGLLIEEYIPHTLPEAVRQTSSADALVGLAVNTAATLVRLGFQPVSLFDDLRSRGKDVVVVDFGSDLGPAIPNHYDHSALRVDLLNFLAALSYDSIEVALHSFDEQTQHL
jgi:hypothetical protein